jgi:hypothetical protein
VCVMRALQGALCFLLGEILSYEENLLNLEKGLCLWR